MAGTDTRRPRRSGRRDRAGAARDRAPHGRLACHALCAALALHAARARADGLADAGPAPATPATTSPPRAPPAQPASAPSQTASVPAQPAQPAARAQSAAPARPAAAPAPRRDEDPVRRPDYTTPRYEVAGFPLLSGNSDIGVQFGGVGTLRRYQDGVRPYRWGTELLLSASVKYGPRGFEIVQQNYSWRFDLPGLLGGRLRLTPSVAFQRTIDRGYYGLGNASDAVRRTGPGGDPTRYFQYIHSRLRVRVLARVELHGPWSAMVAASFRYQDPTQYPGSRLAQDALARNPDGSPLIRGTEPLGLAEAGAGVVLDTRDSEVFPHRGVFHRYGARYVQGFPLDADVHYAAVSAALAQYLPLGSRLTLASRLVVDLQFGNVPFYDLYTGGPFTPGEMPGGSTGVRGVPVGRYLGPIKAVLNLELRAMFFGFSLLRQHFTFGGDAFFDLGRVWSDYTFQSPLDGNDVGIKFGTGAGLYLLWGQSSLFRVEMAYSPDAAMTHPSFPFGVYVEDGVMF